VGGAPVTQSYATAATVDDAIAALAGGARPVAGGTDLVVGARQGKAPLPDSIVAIHRLAELRGVDVDENTLRMRALTTHEEISEHALIRERLTALADASSIVGSHATRAQGTVGGNLMNGSPAMEVGGPLMCFDAAVTLRSQAGERSVAVAELFAGPGRTTAAADELLTEVTVPLPPAGTGSCYARLEYRQQMEIAVVGATAVVTLDVSSVAAAKVAITALAPTIRLVPAAEAALVGSDAGRDAVDAAARAAADASEPISDVRASLEYRRAMAEVLARRAIETAVARARGTAVPVPASRYLHGAA
jgi:CO/xanthine dehydrogenase FAD-binding subunit